MSRITSVALTAVTAAILTACGGGGGATQEPVAQAPVQVQKATPLKVYGTSYENKNSIPADTRLWTGDMHKVVSTEAGVNDRSVAFADFLQDGTYAAFGASLNITGASGTPVADAQGYAYFFKRDASGNWHDVSAELFASNSDRLLCVSPSYSIVADFNNDGKPDVFVSCTGTDAGMPNDAQATQQQRDAWYKSPQYVVLSQPNGKYRTHAATDYLYGHQASAADINGDGNIDVAVTSDPPFVLLGNGDGTFTRNDSILHSDWRAAGTQTPWFNVDYSAYDVYDTGSYAIHLIPVDGRIDLVVGDAFVTHWTKGVRGGFDWNTTRVFPQVYNSNGVRYQFPLDVLYNNGHFYFHTNAATPLGADWAVLKFNATDLSWTTLYNYLNPTLDLKPPVPQVKWGLDGYITAYGTCPLASDAVQGMCDMHVPE